MTIKVRMFTVGGLLTNCYVVWCEKTKETIIVDPAFDTALEADEIFRFIEDSSLKLRFIVNTHGHPDHTCGNALVKEKYRTPILIHEADAHLLGETGRRLAQFFGFSSSSPSADVLLQNEDLVRFGNSTLKVWHTPGHTRGGISLVGEKEVFTGDTLFEGSIGRVDFPESSEEDMKSSLLKLVRLPDEFIVYPGHGLTTTIGKEKRLNPFLQ